MIATEEKLSGLQKASILLMSLDAGASQAVLDRLSPHERELLGAQIVRMRSVRSVVRDQVLDEVSAAIKQSNTRPFAWLESRQPTEIANAIAGERPNTIALVLSHLSSKAAALVLARLDDSCRDKVVKSLAGRNNASPDVIAAVDGLMRQRFDAPPNEDSAGPSRLEITSLDDLVGLSDDQIRALLENVEIDDLSLSLRVASQDVADAVLRNLPSATAQLMREQLQSSARLKIREVEDAQSKVVETMRQAALTGVGSQS